MTDRRLDELLVHFNIIRLVHPSHTCSQRMRVSKWKRYELFGVRGTKSPAVQTSLSHKELVTSNGMRVRLLASST